MHRSHPSATSSGLSGVTPRGFWVCHGASYWWDMPGTLHTGGIQVRCLTTTAGFSVGEPFSHDWTPHPVYKGKARQLSEEALKLPQLVLVILFFQSLPKLAIIGDSRDVHWLLPVSFAFTLSNDELMQCLHHCSPSRSANVPVPSLVNPEMPHLGQQLRSSFLIYSWNIESSFSWFDSPFIKITQIQEKKKSL